MANLPFPGARPQSGRPPAYEALQSEGLRVRLSRIAEETPKGVLSRPLRLPAVLGDFVDTEDADHSEYTTISAGQFSQGAMGGQAARQLRATNIDTLTIEWNPKWLVQRGVDPGRAKDELYKILRSKKAVELLATLPGRRGKTATEMRANITIRSIQKSLKPGEPDTRYYTLTIKEWRDPRVDRRGHSQGRKPGVKLPTTHKLDDNDSLYTLSFQYYGTYKHWRLIANANGLKGFNGAKTALVSLKRFKVGDKVKIPKPPSSSGGNANGTGGVAAPAG